MRTDLNPHNLTADGLKSDLYNDIATAVMTHWPDFRELSSEQLKEMLLSNFQVTDGKIYRRLPVAKRMKVARALWEQRPSELWERLSCPVLLVPAMREPRDPREKRWLAAKAQGLDEARRRLPAVEVLEMRDTIHDVPVQRPREPAQAIIDFAAAAGRA